MTHENQEGSEASRAGILDPEGRLMEGGGRASMERSPRFRAGWRLKRSVQVFSAEDGSVYLLRLGAGDDLVLAEPRPVDRVMLEALDDWSTLPQLERALRANGLNPAEAARCVDDLRDAGVLDTQPPTQILDDAVAERYDRQLIYFSDLADPDEDPARMQCRLGAAHVVILGCGGLGSWVACGLASAGVGSLTLVDDDRVELSNLNRQLLFTEADIGQLKVEAAAEALRAHNGALRVDPVVRRVRAEGDVEALLSPAPDLVIATADWPPHELPRWVNRACISADVPWIGAGQFPPRLRVGPMVVPGRSACLECQEAAIRREHPLYDELAAWRAKGETPDASVGPVCGVIGSLLASEAMHLLIGAFEPATVGRALMVDLRTMEMEWERVRCDPECRGCR